MKINDIGRQQPMVSGATADPKTAPAAGFGEVLQQSLNSVNDAIQEADALAGGLVAGEHSNIHQTMIAMEKANVSFRLITKVQNKAVNAYQEIMRMQL